MLPALGPLLAFASLPVLVSAQVGHAVCSNPVFNWSFDSFGNSPCVVGEKLGGQCTPGGFTIQPLPEGYYYSGVNKPFVTDCVCNTVYYSLLSVCGACQGGYASAWLDWGVNCTEKFTTFPKDLPQNIGVPHWAYLPLLANGTVNFAAAEADNGPEATASALPSSTFVFTSDTSGTNLPAQSTGPSQTSSSKKSAPIGAIVGGVVGGLALIAGVSLALFFLLRRKRNQQAPSAQYMQYNVNNQPMTPTMAEKLYNPNDPSTFPSSPGPTYTSSSPPPPSFVSSPGYNMQGTTPPPGHIPPSPMGTSFMGPPSPQVLHAPEPQSMPHVPFSSEQPYSAEHLYPGHPNSRPVYTHYQGAPEV